MADSKAVAGQLFQLVRRNALIAALVLTLLALVIRLAWLERKSLNLDEANALRIAAMNVPDLEARVRGDQHPPLSFLFMHDWMRLGTSEWIVRLPSAVAGALAIPLLYGLVRVLGGEWSASAAALLLALAPVHVWFSQEARMYPLVCTAGLASALAFAIAVRHTNLLAWGAWIAATVVGLYIHYSMFLIVLAEIVLFAPLWRTSGSRWVTLGLALLALLISAWLFIPQARVLISQLAPGRWSGGYYFIAVQSLLSRVGIQLSSLQFYTVILSAGAMALLALGVLSWVMVKQSVPVRWLAGLALAAVVIYLLILAASAVPRGLGIKRQLLVLFPFALGALATAISAHPSRTRLLIGLVIVTLPLTAYTVMAQEQEDWRDVARLVQEQASPRDMVLINASYMQIPFDYYYQGQAVQQGIGPTSVPQALSEIATSHERLWLLLSQDSLTDPQGVTLAWLDANMRLMQTWSYPGIRVKLYVRNAQ